MIAICFFYLFLSYSSYAQDESWLTPKHQIESSSQSVSLNLDSDKDLEILEIKKVNGLDFIEIKKNNKKIYENKFQTNGLDSQVTHLKHYHLNQEKNLLLFYYDEGYNNWRYFEDIHHVYLLTYDAKKLTHFNLQKISMQSYQQKLPSQPFEKAVYTVHLTADNRLTIERGKIKRNYILQENSWIEN